MTATRDGAGFSEASGGIGEVAAFDRLQEAAAQFPRNETAWTYTILGWDKSPYLTRTLLPRSADSRTLLHRIHRADQDPWPHNHPWRTAKFRCLSGGYTDERWERVGGVWTSRRSLVRPGDINYIDADDFHRALDVLPDTRTVGVVGERVQDWGFMVEGVFVDHATYFARRGHVDLGGLS